jgi:prophage regulatory protein
MTDNLLALDEVMGRVSLCRATIYRWIRAGKFPKSRQLGPDCVRWLESEITDWISNLPTTEPGRGSKADRRQEKLAIQNLQA